MARHKNGMTKPIIKLEDIPEDMVEEFIPDIEQDGLDAYKMDKVASDWERISKELGG